MFRLLSAVALCLAASPLLPAARSADEPPFYSDKTKLLVWRDADGKEHPITKAEDWPKRRAHILANMQLVMGPLPDDSRKVPLDVKVLEAVKADAYTRKKITFAVEKGDRLFAYLLIPHKREGKLPAVLCLHPTNRAIGKGVVVGLGGKPDRHYAVHLAKRGYVTLAPDYVNSGDYKFDPYKNGYASATMKGIWNHMRCVDLLQSLPEVDGERIGVIGHSLGGHNSMFVAAFDKRIKCVVSNCGFCSFPTYFKGNLAGWSHDGYMPRIRSVYKLKPKKMPFDFPGVVAALAPRPFLASAPVKDSNFEVRGVKDCIAAARPVYELLGAKEKLAANYPNCGHDFPDDVRKVAFEWLDRWLKGAKRKQSKAAPGDWPQWRGPQRTGVSAETGLLKQWPEGGPKLLWKATGLGEGYSTPSVADGRLFVMGAKKDEEYLMALDVKNGKLLWSTKVGRVGENHGPRYPGPRSTPTVDGERVYTLGSDGDLICAAVDSGKVVWRRQIEKEFAGNRGTWAYTESVLIDGDKLICTPGGEKATLLALDKKSGEVIWKCAAPGGNQAGYASAIVAQGGGVKQYVQFLGSGVVGVSAADGKFLWRYAGNVGGTSCVTPIFHDGHIFATASGVTEAGGDALLRLTGDGGKPGFKEVYMKRGIANFHGGVVRIGEHVYGTGKAGLACIDLKTGERKWFDRSVGSGSLLAADGRLYLRNTRGTVALVEATPNGYVEKGRLRQPSRSRFPTFCHPVVAGGRLYLRDADLLCCYDIKEH